MRIGKSGQASLLGDAATVPRACCHAFANHSLRIPNLSTCDFEILGRSKPSKPVLVKADHVTHGQSTGQGITGDCSSLRVLGRDSLGNWARDLPPEEDGRARSNGQDSGRCRAIFFEQGRICPDLLTRHLIIGQCRGQEKLTAAPSLSVTAWLHHNDRVASPSLNVVQCGESLRAKRSSEFLGAVYGRDRQCENCC